VLEKISMMAAHGMPVDATFNLLEDGHSQSPVHLAVSVSLSSSLDCTNPHRQWFAAV
jgi:hypothetical protein